MYLQHFGLTEYPFGLTPNTQFFCALPAHQEAMNVLMVALHGGEGFIKITGEVGTGKTMLCRKLLNELGPGFATAYIANPALSRSELLSSVAEEMGISLEGPPNPGHLLNRISGHLLDVAASGRRLVLVLDEAQAIPPESLELLRLLTNLETESRKLLQIVLFGQPELDVLLARADFRQLRQRITFSYRLRPLRRDETRRYLSSRLQVAGWAGRDLLTVPASWLIHSFSRGTPRLLNIIAHKALMVAYGKGAHRVYASHVRAAAADTEAVRTERGWLPRLWLLALLLATGAGWTLFHGMREALP
ncbi:MAG: family ATPase [Proteobacteria bacterium]|nr:family ATPase [Pseudomonadota bacterium]